MNRLDSNILDRIQSAFPVTCRPFRDLAEPLDLEESDLIARIQRLIADNIIRRIGPIFNAAHLGYTSTLVAAQVPPEKIPAFVAEINAHPGISHNYAREHIYNTWFTLTIPDLEEVEHFLTALKNKYGLPEIHSLPALKLFKLNTRFAAAAESDAIREYNVSHYRKTSCDKKSLSRFQIELIQRLQQDLPVIPEPFHAVAEDVNRDADEILEQIRQWLHSGHIRRFGASVRHQNMGYTANGMAVFQIEPDRIDTAGHALAEFPQVSHCYHRPPAPQWPYNLFAMTHARNPAELNNAFQKMIARLEPIRYDCLLTTKEFKKDTIKYFYDR